MTHKNGKKKITYEIHGAQIDTCTKDMVRLARLPYSINQKSKTRAEILEHSKITYSLTDIRDGFYLDCDPEPKTDIDKIFEAIEKMTSQCIEPLNLKDKNKGEMEVIIQAHMREQTRYGPNVVSHCEKVKLPADYINPFFEKIDVLVPIDKAKAVQAGPKIREKKIPTKQQLKVQTNNTKKINLGRIADLHKLQELQGANFNKRQYAVWLYRLTVLLLTKNEDKALDAAIKFNNRFSQFGAHSLEMSRIHGTESSTNKYILDLKSKGRSYKRWKDITIISLLEITDKELQHLNTIKKEQ